ncbi:MAG TPA: PSD1 and planctomycete cytochrome C domain-containing protein [Chthonomonadaceae bacterium]|nr:PSD1 and planctomycete cytochrome C domain-containing protein [Chthonomonadaceae bacterium]
MGEKAIGSDMSRAGRIGKRIAVMLAALLLVSAARAGQGVGQTPEQTAFFEQNIRPLLAQRCYACHADKNKVTQGGLALDSAAGWQHGGSRGPALKSGDTENSLLLKAVRYKGNAPKMPPNGKLSDREIALLTEWVKRGAPGPKEDSKPPTKPSGVDVETGRKRWAFQPIQRVAPPTVKSAAWAQNPIDRFILAKLEAKGLRPNPEADRRTLIRRVTFDLTGLPPTPEEIQAFVNDASPNAYETLVDRLLASPRYGERWGRFWLDLARFAESHGYEQDYDRPYAYHYRDFVIKAFNSDMPYDQFVRWQLAGDEIAPEEPLALMATGFLGAGTHSTQITKNQVEKERYDELDDMTATTGTAFLGLTIGCARCHNHKYDPIPTRDYYRLLSTFTTTVRSDYDVNMDPAGYRKAKAAFDAEHAPLTDALQAYERDRLPGHLAAYLQSPSHRAQPTSWMVLGFQSIHSEGGATLTPQPDGSLLASGTNPDFDTYIFTAKTSLRGLTAIRLEALADPSFVKGGPGRAGNGNFALSDFRVTAAHANAPDKAVPVKLLHPRATFEQAGLPVAATIDADPRSAWAVDPQFGKNHAAVYDLETPLGFEGGTLLTFTLKFANNNGHNIGRPRLSVATGVQPLAFDAPALPERVAALLSADPNLASLAADDRAALLNWYKTQDAGWQALNERVQKHLAAQPQQPIQKVMICSEGVPAIRTHTQGGDFLEQTHFLVRGDPNNKGDVATQSFLQVLMRSPDGEKRWQTPPPAGWRTSYRRRALAEWITDTEEGAGDLLARVIVNRLWQHHMGRGIVATPSDFGAQGEPPTHPELLDYLASELIREGWHLKAIHRRILLSATYRQSAAANPAAEKLDPANRLCWRHSRQRLEAEAIRDALLAVGGELDLTMYGPGTLDEGMKRRSIYFMVKRSKLIPMLRLFDGPDALLGIGSRPSTTIAPQALLLLNNPNIHEYARSFARRVAPRPDTPPADAIATAYLLALGRAPTPNEKSDALAFVQAQTASYRAANPSDAPQMALADFCQVLMGLNEFIYVD